MAAQSLDTRSAELNVEVGVEGRIWKPLATEYSKRGGKLVISPGQEQAMRGAPLPGKLLIDVRQVDRLYCDASTEFLEIEGFLVL